MATSRPRPSAASSRRATSRAPSRRSAAAEVEVVEEAAGMDLGTGLGIVTAFLLVVALVLVDYEMGKHLGAGILVK
jgi:hypothetical protein